MELGFPEVKTEEAGLWESEPWGRKCRLVHILGQAVRLKRANPQ